MSQGSLDSAPPQAQSLSRRLVHRSPRTDGVHDSGSGNSFLRGREEEVSFRRAGANLAGSNRSPPIPEKVAEEEEDDLAVKWCDLGMSVLAGLAGQMEYSGGGTGKGKNVGRGRRGGDGDHDDNRRISDYYQQMLETDSANPLLLRNYGRFLHEVRVLSYVLGSYAQFLWDAVEEDEEEAPPVARTESSSPSVEAF
ncbi:hypothetical protein ZIOFF_045507 [Zingiber officinale]|uniref:Uncharacterized protein n=1 Tax=Zingiber officinale TaxID=94328 RepID=A0A8J5KVC2_ZINOF|nr:hypothetical protein ZIOFF_045507 [Zingiber officinale]